jgi:hypothetical protein
MIHVVMNNFARVVLFAVYFLQLKTNGVFDI